jgi:hypothetical protein
MLAFVLIYSHISAHHFMFSEVYIEIECRQKGNAQICLFYLFKCSMFRSSQVLPVYGLYDVTMKIFLYGFNFEFFLSVLKLSDHGIDLFSLNKHFVLNLKFSA